MRSKNNFCHMKPSVEYLESVSVFNDVSDCRVLKYRDSEKAFDMFSLDPSLYPSMNIKV